MKILDATPAKLLELFWKANPKTINGTLLDFISNNNFGLIADGCFYSVSEVMKLSDEVPHFVERFSLERKYSGAINIEGNLAIHDYIDCSVRTLYQRCFIRSVACFVLKR
ncbi:hypothetical protein [Cellvibrio sp.]|uniref:hypothetical protein n=1 Tax=Cellvibrio sp. TaxID=1965322 RepID=UPI00396489A9